MKAKKALARRTDKDSTARLGNIQDQGMQAFLSDAGKAKLKVIQSRVSRSVR